MAIIVKFCNILCTQTTNEELVGAISYNISIGTFIIKRVYDILEYVK